MPPAPVAFEAAGAGGAGSPARLEHAYLQLHEPSMDGSLSKPGPKLDRIDFQFNPKELSLSKRAVWKESPATGNKKAGPPQYTGPQPTSLTLEMFFDASDTLDSSVVKKVERLFSCCVPTSASFGQKKASPPWVLFRWGALTGFLAYIESVTATYTLFTSAGLPVRATCTVTLNEIAGEQPGQNPTSGGLVPRREHVLRAGDTLAGIAYAEYGDPSLWRAVAELNGVDDPVRLRPGRRLLLPAVDELPRVAVPRGDRAREVARAGD
ncbi:CIS tube protein [Occultella gossypii]|uniref:LysM peptidoglycan-binding domain-containing protein n=1 Tax=Occultella gossypii TaxID=2800820 RepID=A0ABS7SCS2_9MICO|nr:LysM peptidoglycan-binding domain-containing protein [Occultella gossypii]MBZ2197048.1 LysM peptidoglycan-binding domain-containing protein [Occultella gossypii]